jgi:hypothetical protein
MPKKFGADAPLVVFVRQQTIFSTLSVVSGQWSVVSGESLSAGAILGGRSAILDSAARTGDSPWADEKLVLTPQIGRNRGERFCFD